MVASAEHDAYPTTSLDAARLYGAMEWRVVPVTPGSKVPAVRDWVNVATTDPAVIDGWWNSLEFANCGVAIVTGRKSGLWVLDVDVANGKVGLETLKALIAEHGEGKLPDTLVTRTPTGGFHYFWQYPQGVEVYNSASNRLGAGLDVRGEGGQVNAPPTTRKIGGYCWHRGRGPYDAKVAPAPAWLVDLVAERPKATTPPVPSLSAVSETNKLLLDAPGFVADYNASHTWDDLLMRDGWTLSGSDAHGVRFWTRPGKEERDGISASTNYAGTDCLYVWTTSISWLPSERMYDRYGYMVHRHFDGDFKAAGREQNKTVLAGPSVSLALVPDGPPVSPPPVPGETAGENGTSDGVPEIQKLSLMRSLKVDFSADGAFWNTDLEESDFLIPPFIARGRGHALYASAKAGKSYVVLQAIAAACIPGHKSWAEPVAEPISVLYLDYEMTEADLRERLEMFGYSKGDDYSRLHYVKASGMGADLDTPDGGAELVAHAVEWGVDLVVVDTLSRAVKGEENEADTVRAFYHYTGGRLKQPHNIALLRLDHAGKDIGRGQRGTSSKNDDVDVVWRLERAGNGNVLKCTHQRMGWLPEEIVLNYTEDDDGHSYHVRGVVSFPEGTKEIMDALAAADAPLDVSRAQARRDYGIRGKNEVLQAAIQCRKQEIERRGINGILG